MTTPTTEAKTTKRLNINLPEPVFNELQELASDSQQSMTSLVRTAFALAQLTYEERAKGNKLVVQDHSGKTVKEIVIPHW
jgi:hypothetical protein